MIRKLIRKVANNAGYDIVKYTNPSPVKYKADSSDQRLDLFDTPTGKYYLPKDIENDFVANSIKQGVYFENEVIEDAKQYIKKGTAVLDVGANYGQMSVFFSKAVGAEGKVYAFEAEPLIASILEKTIAANECNNIQIVNNAVYNKSGEKLVFPEPDFIKFSSYGSYGIDPKAKNGRTIESIKIDDLNIQEPISFMKVDVQGCDLFAMQGAKETILKNRMPILFEFEEQFQSDFGTSFQDYVDFTNEIGYKFVKTILNINYLIVSK